MKSAMLLAVLLCWLVARVSAESVENRLRELEKQVQQEKQLRVELELDLQNEKQMRVENDRQMEAKLEQEKLLRVEMQKGIDELRSQREASQVSAAFSTRLHEDTEIADSPVIFGTVDLNIGDGYDEFTGVFVPPVDGVYLLMVYVTSTAVQNGPMFIKRNGDVLCQGWVTDGGDENTWDMMACSAVATLVVGDSVRVTGSADEPAIIGAPDSGFLGHIIVE